MSEIFLTAEAEEAREPTHFSVVALFGFLLSAAGLFSIQYIHMMPIALIGAALGTLALLISKRYRFGFLSKSLGFLALTIGAITVSFSVFYMYIENNYDLQQARKTAETYLDFLSKGDLDHVAFLAGSSIDISEPESASKAVMLRIRDDLNHKEIQERKNSKWLFVNVESEYVVANGHTFKLIYKDASQTVPKYYSIFVRKNCDKHEWSKPTINWFVDKIDTAKKS
ncbi:MAG: hypothetical protein NTY15_00510 [Planctomycetota bacterium]|nr:hypothetical protein [Planctomycetota bacterium]